MSVQRPVVASHTQVPSLVQDLILPLLTHGEVMCLLYVLRRTHGFAAPEGGRKTKDRISLTQFEHGIVSGDYILDLGTGLRRNTIVSCLRSLQENGLVDVSPVCDRCRWGADPDEQPADQTLLNKGARCPRCRRTLSKVYGLAELTPRKMVAFLNANDPRGRTWTFDHEMRRFRVVPEAQDAAPPAPAPASGDYRSMLWYPDLVDQAMEQFAQARGRALRDEEKIRHFYTPVLALQELSAQFPAILKHALTETLKKKIPGSVRESRGAGGRVSRRSNTSWHRYTKAIVEKQLALPAFTHRSDPAASPTPGAPAASPENLRAREQGAQELLERARELNREGDHGAARAVLSEVLAQVPHLAAMFGGSQELADAHLRLAFKKGQRDFQSAHEALAIHDYYPEWSWPQTLEPHAA